MNPPRIERPLLTAEEKPVVFASWLQRMPPPTSKRSVTLKVDVAEQIPAFGAAVVGAGLLVPGFEIAPRSPGPARSTAPPARAPRPLEQRAG